jgi:hypothetical protein
MRGKEQMERAKDSGYKMKEAFLYSCRIEKKVL